MAGRKDGDDFNSGARYLELAGIIIQYGDKNHVGSDLDKEVKLEPENRDKYLTKCIGTTKYVTTRL